MHFLKEDFSLEEEYSLFFLPLAVSQTFAPHKMQNIPLIMRFSEEDGCQMKKGEEVEV